MKDIKTIPALEARMHLGEIMKRAYKDGERFIVEKSGIPMVVILRVTEYTQFIQEREERFKALDRIWAKAPKVPVEETEKDVQKAIQATRKKKRHA